jgi:hypothetical protein
LSGWQARYVCPLFPISYLNPPYLQERRKRLRQEATGTVTEATVTEREGGQEKGKRKRRESKQGGSRRKLLKKAGQREGGCGALVWVEVRGVQGRGCQVCLGGEAVGQEM